MKKALVFFSLLTVTGIIFFSCSKSNPVNPVACDGVTNKTFAADVNPIIQTFCNQASCHNPGSVNGPGALTNYSEVFNARSAIRGQVQAGLMPQNTTLTTAQKNSIICWIDNGAPNN
jgi:hypothetical protein